MGGGLYYIPTKDELDIERDRGIFEDYIIKRMKINSVRKMFSASMDKAKLWERNVIKGKKNR